MHVFLQLSVKNTIVSSEEVALNNLRANILLFADWVLPDVRVVSNSYLIVVKSLMATVFSVVDRDVLNEFNLTHVTNPPRILLMLSVCSEALFVTIIKSIRSFFWTNIS